MLARQRGDLVVVDVLGLLVHPVVDGVEPLAGEGHLRACVEVPAGGSDIASRVSPGFMKAPYTAWFALAPLCGCTLAWSASNSAWHRSMAMDSALSTSEQPP